MSKCTSKNLVVDTDDSVKVAYDDNAKYATKLHVLPFADTIDKVSGDIIQSYLTPYYMESYRPATKGNTFQIKGVEFKIIDIEPSNYAIISPETVIYVDGEPL